MRRMIVIGTVALLFVVGAGGAGAQESRPVPGGPMGPGGHGGGMMGPGGMMGMPGGMPGMRGRDHLEHLMVHDPKAAARIMRFRADMLRAISDVLQKHAAELEKSQ